MLLVLPSLEFTRVSGGLCQHPDAESNTRVYSHVAYIQISYDFTGAALHLAGPSSQHYVGGARADALTSESVSYQTGNSFNSVLSVQ